MNESAPDSEAGKTAPKATPKRTPDTPPRKSWARRYLSLPTLLSLGVIVYFSIFSETSIRKKIEYQRIIDSLRIELELQQDTLRYYQSLNRRLSTDRDLMEQVVREQYNMNRPNEDVFIFEKK